MLLLQIGWDLMTSGHDRLSGTDYQWSRDQLPPQVVLAVLLALLSLIVSLIVVPVQTIWLVQLYVSDDTNRYKCACSTPTAASQYAQYTQMISQIWIEWLEAGDTTPLHVLRNSRIADHSNVSAIHEMKFGSHSPKLPCDPVILQPAALGAWLEV
jgi:hypothetical protein